MELAEFLSQTQAEIRAEIQDRMANADGLDAYSEGIFTERVMNHMAEFGMTGDPQVCHVSAKVGSANIALSGYAFSEQVDQLDLFVSLYGACDEITPISDSEVKAKAEQCIRFLSNCVQGRLATSLDASHEAYPLVRTLRECYATLDQIRIYVLTDKHAKAKKFQPRDVNGKLVMLEVMDIERLFRHWSEGKPREELVVDFVEACGDVLPCVHVPGSANEYDYALTVVPGEALRFVYERFGQRILEANVRSFLGTTGKVNKAIRDTLRDRPGRFMAYNNGIVVVADEIGLAKTKDNGPGIRFLKGMQIVNGGQTTASIYFTKRKDPGIDLSTVRVPMKVIKLRADLPADEEAIISDISRCANSQNAVRLSDLSANKPFHVELEKLSFTTYCPDGIGRWFYERATGSYNTHLAREGTTPARLRQLKDSLPAARKITKTDLAKFLNAWDQEPQTVSLGAQKNFESFMRDVDAGITAGSVSLPDVQDFKNMVAKAILYKRAHSLVRPMFKAFQGNVAAYVIALISEKLGDRFVLDRVWNRQGVSDQLADQIRVWAHEVHDVLQRTAGGRMLSEWAKRDECWSAVRDATYSHVRLGIPELS